MALILKYLQYCRETVWCWQQLEYFNLSIWKTCVEQIKFKNKNLQWKKIVNHALNRYNLKFHGHLIWTRFYPCYFSMKIATLLCLQYYLPLNSSEALLCCLLTSFDLFFMNAHRVRLFPTHLPSTISSKIICHILLRFVCVCFRNCGCKFGAYMYGSPLKK